MATPSVRPLPSNFPPIISLGRQTVWYDDLYHRILRWSWLTFFILFAVLFVAVNLLFAAIYSLPSNAISNVHNFEDAFYSACKRFARLATGRWRRRAASLIWWW